MELTGWALTGSTHIPECLPMHRQSSNRTLSFVTIIQELMHDIRCLKPSAIMSAKSFCLGSGGS